MTESDGIRRNPTELQKVSVFCATPMSGLEVFEGVQTLSEFRIDCEWKKHDIYFGNRLGDP
jgi:hypothetical protein